MGRRARSTRVAVVLAAVGVAPLATAPVAAGPAAIAPAAADPAACAPRSVTTVASGLGVLENLAFDERGGLLVSNTSFVGPGALRRITPDGSVTTVLPEVTGPGGIVVDGPTVCLNVGNTTVSGLLSMPDDLTIGPDGALYIALNLGGAVLRVDPATGHSCRIAEGIPLMSSLAFGSGPGWDPNVLYTTGFDGTVRAVHPV
ncbi:SMP-30/gluconolactonase/LRE family protein [Rhodococcus rhodochrous]|uniref:SMP-30/gluconolactonase/LRE family protein n=1 Tax=Rhodococcus rhodochrous TaxID=1829 RepID=UPI003B8369D9